MKIGYYPGCTLKTKAKNLEDAALAALDALDIEVEELERWNCCGAVYSLADDDLIHHVAAVRDLVRAQEQGFDKVVTLCSQCYNVLARANLMMREDEEKRDTINRFMDEEADYRGEVEVVHLLHILRDDVGWDTLKEKVKVTLGGLRVAPFYGCTLLRPTEVALDGDGRATAVHDLLTALGAEAVEFPAAEECCSAYETLINPTEGLHRAGKVLNSALSHGADALVLSCPLCEYNLGHRQNDIADKAGDLPVFYFSQLLAVALGCDKDLRFDLNVPTAKELLENRELLTASA